MIPRIMAMSGNHFRTSASTAGGTLLSIIASIQSGDVTKTIVLATGGARQLFGVAGIEVDNEEVVARPLNGGGLFMGPLFFRW